MENIIKAIETEINNGSFTLDDVTVGMVWVNFMDKKGNLEEANEIVDELLGY